jgi:hypothetical protein
MAKRKISVFDFDSTLVDTPIGSPENKKMWADYHGKPWPYLGWWGRDESLDTDVWPMNPIKEVYDAYKREIKNPETVVAMLTGRLQKQEVPVKKILDSIGYKFDHYLFNTRGGTLQNKINHLNNLLSKYPDVRSVELWDDRLEHFEYFEAWGENLQELGRIDSFHLNKIKSDHWDTE